MAMQTMDLQEGIRLLNMKHIDEALELFEKKGGGADLAVAQDNRELTYYMAICYAKLARYEEAVTYLEEVVAKTPSRNREIQCRMTLAYIYVMTNRVRMAEFELSRVMKTGYETPQLYCMMGYASWSQGQYQKAVEWYNRAIRLDEKNATALNCLGFILADTEADRAKGLRLCKQAVELRPKSAACLDSLGWAHYKNGNAAEAVLWLRKALELAPGCADIQNHIDVIAGAQR